MLWPLKLVSVVCRSIVLPVNTLNTILYSKIDKDSWIFPQLVLVHRHTQQTYPVSIATDHRIRCDGRRKGPLAGGILNPQHTYFEPRYYGQLLRGGDKPGLRRYPCGYPFKCPFPHQLHATFWYPPTSSRIGRHVNRSCSGRHNNNKWWVGDEGCGFLLGTQRNRATSLFSTLQPQSSAYRMLSDYL